MCRGWEEGRVPLIFQQVVADYLLRARQCSGYQEYRSEEERPCPHRSDTVGGTTDDEYD